MEERKPRRKRGTSPYGNFEQSKAIAEETIRVRREADALKTQRLREPRLARNHSSGGTYSCPFNHRDDTSRISMGEQSKKALVIVAAHFAVTKCDVSIVTTGLKTTLWTNQGGGFSRALR